jgi:hypothetical protein
MQQDNNKSSRLLRARGLAALRARIAVAIDFIGGRSSLLLLALTLSVLLGTATTLSAQQATIVVAPPRINPNTTVILTVTSPSGLDLSTLAAAQVAIHPNDGVFGLVPRFSQNELSVSLIIGDAQLGPRTLIFFGPDLRVLASAELSVVAVGGLCPGHQNCCRTDQTTHLCTDCRNQCPPLCPSDKHCCEQGDHGECIQCIPKSQNCR